MKLLLSLAAVATLAAPAVARPAAPPVRIVVSTGGLDLASAAGQDRLDRRIARAADTACGTASSVDLVGQRRVRVCRSEAVRAALPQRDAALAQAPLAVAAAAR